MPRPFAAVGHAIADFDFEDIAVFFHHNPSPRIAQHCVFFEFCHHLRQSAERTGDLHHIPNLLEMTFIPSQFPYCAMLMNTSGFCPAAYEREYRSHEDVTGLHCWIGDPIQNDLSKSPTDHLFHDRKASLFVRNNTHVYERQQRSTPGAKPIEVESLSQVAACHRGLPGAVHRRTAAALA